MRLYKVEIHESSKLIEHRLWDALMDERHTYQSGSNHLGDTIGDPSFAKCWFSPEPLVLCTIR